MKLKRTVCLLLAVLLVIGLFAGCSKKNDGQTPGDSSSNGSLADQTKPSGGAKYAYEASYIDLQMDDSISSVNTLCAAGDRLYLSAYVDGEEVTYTDPTSGESWSYNQTEDALFTIDAQTGACTKLPNFTVPGVPEAGDESVDGSANLSSMLGADDGTLWLQVDIYATKYDLPEDFNPETMNKWDYPSTDMSSSLLLHLDTDGSTLMSLDASTLDAETDDASQDSSYGPTLNSFTIDGAGNLYLSDGNHVHVLDKDGNALFQLDASEYGGSMTRLSGTQVGVIWYNYNYSDTDAGSSDENGEFFIPVDLETKAWGEKIKLPMQAWQFYPGDDAYDCYYNYNGNIYGYSFETGAQDKLVDWIACDVNSNDLYSYCFLPGGRVAAISVDWSADPISAQLVVLTRVDASTVQEKTVLTLACMYLDYDLRSAIVEYNKSNDKYRINVVDYSEYNTDTDYSAGITKLTTEILGGSVPDLFLCSSLPIGKYAAKGLIADLYTFMDKDDTMTRSYFVPQVLSALEKDGKLYELPVSFGVQTAYVLSSIADQYDTWNVAAVQDAIKQLQDGATIFSNGWTKSDVLNNCLARNLTAFVDWTTGKCTFDSDAFKALLAFADSFPDSVDNDGVIAYSSTASASDLAVADAMEYDSWEDDATRVERGKQLMATISLYSFDDYIYNVYALRDKISFVGYPTEDGKAGNTFFTNGEMAISAVSKHQDAAWDFIRYVVEKRNSDQYLYNFPISQAAFDEKMTEAMTEEYQLDGDGNQVDWDDDGEPDKASKGGYQTVENGETVWKDVYALTQEDVDQILGIISATTSVYEYDTEILNIITDEVAAYFAGDKDVDATASMIQSRVNLYVQEQR